MGTIYLARTDRIFNPNARFAVDSQYFQHNKSCTKLMVDRGRDGALHIFVTRLGTGLASNGQVRQRWASIEKKCRRALPP
jgi:hypothetical protein